MKRRDVVALVAGTTVGVGGGTLSAFLACATGWALVQRFLDRYSYIDLGHPAPPGGASAPTVPAAYGPTRPQASMAASGIRT